MTDANNSSQHVLEIRYAFEPFFLTTTDVEVFRENWLRKDGALVFAVELQVQNLADFVIESYRNHAESTKRNVAVLAPANCRVQSVDPIGIASRV